MRGTLRGLARDWQIGWRNLGRNRRRTLLAWGAIALAQITMVWVASFMNGYTATIFGTLTGPLLGHVQIHAKRYLHDRDIGRRIPDARELEAEIAALPHVRRVSPRVYGPVLATQRVLGHVATVTGLDLAVERAPGGLLDGLPVSEIPGPNEVLVGGGLAREMDVGVGDTLALMGQAADGSIASGLYRVKGLVETSVDPVNQSGILMDLRTAQDFLAMDDAVHELMIHADEPARIPAVAAAVRRLPAVRSLEVVTWDQIAPQLAALLKVADTSSLLILVLIFITTVAGVANTMLMATFERSHEFGMLLALGCRPGRLIRMLLLESIALGLAGAAIGSALGIALTLPGVFQGIDLGFASRAGTGFAMEGISLSGKFFLVLRPGDVLVGLVAVIVTSILASLWPASRIAHLEPVEALRS